jgi:hypothetical protein
VVTTINSGGITTMMPATRKSLLRLTVGMALACAVASSSIAQPVANARGAPDEAASTPDFSGVWLRARGKLEQPEGGGPGPVEQISPRPDIPIGNYKNPILQPWAAAIVKHNGEMEAAGQPVPEAKTTCWPSSVPGFFAIPTSVEILQTPRLVTLISRNDHQVRFVYMDQPHSSNVTPSWYGESVGHYQGDTLVVDTISIATKPMSFVDTYGTPHTDKLHVVERYRMVNGDKTLKVALTVEDPGTFTTPWSAVATLQRTRDGFDEYACAENNPMIGIGPSVGEMPRAKYVPPF